MNFWAWATEHWFLGFILMYTAIQLPFKIFNLFQQEFPFLSSRRLCEMSGKT